MTAVASFIISSCLILVSGAANTSVTDVNVTTALQPTNSTDSWRDDLNLTTILPTKPQNDSMSLTVPIFLTPTPSPTSNLTTDDESPGTWETTPSTPSEIDSDEVFNPYPGYYLPTNVTLFPTSMQNQSRPLPTTSYIASTPPPTPTMTISTTNPNPVIDNDSGPITVEPQTTSAAPPPPGFDKSYFRLLMAMYLGTFTLILIYIVKE